MFFLPKLKQQFYHSATWFPNKLCLLSSKTFHGKMSCRSICCTFICGCFIDVCVSYSLFFVVLGDFTHSDALSPVGCIIQQHCCIQNTNSLSLVCQSVSPDEWRDFHDCRQDFLQPLSEGDQEASRHVSSCPAAPESLHETVPF